MEREIVEFVWQAAAGGVAAEAAVAPVRRVLGSLYSRLKRQAEEGNRAAFDEELDMAASDQPQLEDQLRQIFDELPEAITYRVLWTQQVSRVATELRLLTDRVVDAEARGATTLVFEEARDEMANLFELAGRISDPDNDKQQLVVDLSHRYNAWLDLLREQADRQGRGEQPDLALLNRRHKELYDWYQATFVT